LLRVSFVCNKKIGKWKNFQCRKSYRGIRRTCCIYTSRIMITCDSSYSWASKNKTCSKRDHFNHLFSPKFWSIKFISKDPNQIVMRDFSKRANILLYIIGPVKLSVSFFSTNGSEFNRNIKKHSYRTCQVYDNIYYSLSIADANSHVTSTSRLFYVTPLKLITTCPQPASTIEWAQTCAFDRCGRDSGKVLRETPRDVEAPKAPSTRRGNVYARLSVFRRRSTRDATRRDATACVAGERVRRLSRRENRDEAGYPRGAKRARPSARPSRSQQNVRLPTGCHEEWQDRVIDSSTIATSWWYTI